MRNPFQYLSAVLVVFLVAGCSSSDDTAEETPTTTTRAPAATVAAPETATTSAATTTEASTTTEATTTTLEPWLVDDTMAPTFVADVRDAWARTERTVGGTAPEVTDDEMVAIGSEICEYLTANPLPNHSPENADARMPVYTDAAAKVAGGLGIAYEPAMQDAGFESGTDLRYVTAFRYVADDGGLCPAPASEPCREFGCLLFGSPWSAQASG